VEKRIGRETKDGEERLEKCLTWARFAKTEEVSGVKSFGFLIFRKTKKETN
jgi:hypothetical protein